jgi:BirA family transcriptional regulator, biotin operon repressor / biotin---[acetyl-CoA-carboxylase] ligase
VLLRPTLPPAQWPRLTHLAAVALLRALDGLGLAGAAVKWPNEIFFADRKVAGLLLESVFGGPGGAFALLGIGLNVNQVETGFPPVLRATATSLRLAQNRQPLERETVAVALLRSLDTTLAAPAEQWPAVLDFLRGRSQLLGRAVRAHCGEKVWEGVAVDYSAEGELILQKAEGGREALASVDLIRPV